MVLFSKIVKKSQVRIYKNYETMPTYARHRSCEFENHPIFKKFLTLMFSVIGNIENYHFLIGTLLDR